MDEYKSIFILGRQPALGRAEIESIYGAGAVLPFGEHAALCRVPPDEIDFTRLGGAVRLAKPLARLETKNWAEVTKALGGILSGLTDDMPLEGKIKLGLSTFGLQSTPKQLMATGFELKKALKSAGRSVRLVPNTEPQLSSAQVLHNRLTSPLGLELLLIGNSNQTFVAATAAIQNIDAYARRDQSRPKRDARVGMLPPKLAQIIVNLAAAGQQTNSKPFVVLDPFCGTGVILQESLLMGYEAYGTDLQPRLVDYSRENLEWLATRGQTHTDPQLEAADATNHRWQHFDAIASETYLGRPFSAPPAPDVLAQVMGDVNAILTKFLQNAARQTRPGFRMCIAVPAWHANRGFKHLPLIDHLNNLGYNRVSFEHATNEELIYYRPNQVVARQLLVVTRK